MSEWTVSGAGDHNDLLNDVLQRVGVDDDEDPVSTGNFVSPTKGSKHRDPSDSPIAENGIPVPLNPADLTPNKDPLEGFTAWIRGQQTTPGSQGRSPTPPGASPFMQTYSGAFHRSSAMVSPAAPRPLNFTPQKPYGGYGTGGMRAIGMDQLQGAAGFGGYGASGTPTRSGVQAPLLPNGTPMHMGTPTTPYPHQSDMSGMGGMYGPSATYNGAYGGGGGGYGNNGGYGGAGMDAMYDPYAGVTAQASAENIRGRVYETAKDQHGCRFLQRLLDAATSYEGAEIAQVIMLEVVPHVAELMTDQYANFLVQKLFDMMPQEVRFRVAQVAGPYMSQIALTPHGTFSIQKMIETIATREEMEIVQQALSKDVVQLVKDVHGNHVIQKVLQRFEHPDKQFIYDAMASDCVPIATNKQGCCVLQRCLEFASPEQRFMLVNSVVDCSHLLVQDPFGNYVVQYVLEANEMSVNDAIAKMLLPNFMMLCMNKFSSNVIEKILRLISNTVRDEFVLHLKDLNTLSHLLQDDYGNYVVQTALNVASPQQADQLVQLIRPQMHLIRNAPYAKKLEAKMDLVARKQRGMRHNGPGSFSHRSTDSPMSANYSSPSSSHSSPPHLHHHQSPAHSDHMAASPMHHGPVGASPLNVQHGHQQHHHHHHNHQGAHPHHQQQPFGGQQPVQQPSPVREAPTTPVAQSHPSVNAAPFTPGQHHQGHRRSTPDTPAQGNSPGHHHSPSTANIVAPTTQQQAAPQQAEAREVPVAARGGRYRGGAHGGAHTGGNGQQQHAPASPTAANQQHASSSNNHHEHRGGGGGGGAWKGNRRSH